MSSRPRAIPTCCRGCEQRIITAGSIVGTVPLGAFTGYVIARSTTPVEQGGVLPVPDRHRPAHPVGYGAPLHRGPRGHGPDRSAWGMIILYTGMLLPLSIFLYAGFFRGLGTDYEEAATIDGARGTADLLPHRAAADGARYRDGRHPRWPYRLERLLHLADLPRRLREPDAAGRDVLLHRLAGLAVEQDLRDRDRVDDPHPCVLPVRPEAIHSRLRRRAQGLSTDSRTAGSSSTGNCCRRSPCMPPTTTRCSDDRRTPDDHTSPHPTSNSSSPRPATTTTACARPRHPDSPPSRCGATGVDAPSTPKDLPALKAALDETGIQLTAQLAEPRTQFMIPPWDHSELLEARRGRRHRRTSSVPPGWRSAAAPGSAGGSVRCSSTSSSRSTRVIAQIDGSGITLVLEPVNVRVDHPGSLLDRTSEAVYVARGVDSPYFGDHAAGCVPCPVGRGRPDRPGVHRRAGPVLRQGHSAGRPGGVRR